MKKRSAIRYNLRSTKFNDNINEDETLKTKQCGRCRYELPLDAFGKLISSADGLNAYCKVCRASIQKDHRERARHRPSKARKYRREHRPSLLQKNATRRFCEHPHEVLLKQAGESTSIAVLRPVITSSSITFWLFQYPNEELIMALELHPDDKEVNLRIAEELTSRNLEACL